MYHKRFLICFVVVTLSLLGCEEAPPPGTAMAGTSGSNDYPTSGTTSVAGQSSMGPSAGIVEPGGQIGFGGSVVAGGQPSTAAAISGGESSMGGTPASGGQPTTGGSEPHDGFTSLKNNLRFKGVYRLKNEFINMLSLSANSVCNELGRYSCFDFVHEITLGGVDAYEANIYQAPSKTTAVAPMAVERVALHACTQRYDLDVGQPDASLIYGSLDYSPDGSQLADVNSLGVTSTLETLFKRVLLRIPTDDELSMFRQMYTDIAANVDAVKPAREWAILSCFVLTTSIESLFY